MSTGEPRPQTLSRLLPQLESAPLADLPIGIYVADAGGRLVYGNREARALMALPDGDDNLGAISELYADADTWPKLVLKAGQPGKTLVHLVVEGRDLWVEHHLASIPYEDHEQNGLYIGCMVDVTEDHLASARTRALQETVRELTFDIGQILHANTSTLVLVNQTLMAAGRALEPELLADDAASHPEALDRLLASRAAKLVAAMGRLVSAGDAERRDQALPPERWDKLAGVLPMLEGYEEMIPVPEMRVSALRAVTNEILSACRELEPGYMPKEVVRDSLRAASDLERLTCFMDITASRTAVLQMDTSLAALRDFITTEIRTDDPSTRFTVASILREGIAHLSEFARAARVDVVWRNRSEDIEVFGNRRDLLRAVTNLLHNAIKYSWRREGHDAPWISVDISDDGDNVRIDVENWGVPVEQGEIEEGLIFQMGYRGKRSKDRGRLGTGIGLTDSQRVAEASRGSLTVTSRPARGSSPDSSERDYYRQPFLTKVTLTVPLAV
jgi:signal transduction histidine kinase